MTPPTEIARLRLALSYREKAIESLGALPDGAAGGTLKTREVADTRVLYEEHRRAAESAIEAARAGLQHLIQDSRQRLDRFDAQRATLLSQAERGEISPEEANAHSRRLVNEKQETESRISALERAVRASSCEMLGGRLDHPLDAYPKLLQLAGAPQPETKDSRRQALLFVVFLCAAVLALVLFSVFRLSGSVTFSATPANASGTLVSLRCANNSTGVIQWYVPWPEGTPVQPVSDRGTGTAYGVQVLVRERGRSEYVPLPNTDGAWRWNTPPVTSSPVELLPGLYAEVVFDAEALSRQGYDVEGVRLICSKAGGRVELQHEISL